MRCAELGDHAGMSESISCWELFAVGEVVRGGAKDVADLSEASDMIKSATYP